MKMTPKFYLLLVSCLFLRPAAAQDGPTPYPVLELQYYEQEFRYPTYHLDTPPYLSADWQTIDMHHLPCNADSVWIFPEREFKKEQFRRNGFYNSLQIGYARKLGITGSKDIVIAIIDDGIGFDEESYDLEGKEWTNVDEIPENGIDDDGNGYIDDVYGWDFHHNTGVRDSLVNDHLRGHGTRMARTIGATDNSDCLWQSQVEDPFDSRICGNSFVGIMNEVTLMNVKVMGTNGFLERHSALAKGIRYAADNGADIINISIAYFVDIPFCPAEVSERDLIISYDRELTWALDYAWSKGCLIVAGVGNRYNFEDASDYTKKRRAHHNQIANHPAVLGVGGLTDWILLMADFFFAIPPGDIHSVVTFSTYQGGHTLGKRGTSYSSAIVSGLAGLLKSVHPEYTNLQLKEIILEAAIDTINTQVPLDGKQYYQYSDSISLVEKTPEYYGTPIIPDSLGHDEYYGHGFVRWPEIYHEVKYRDITIDPATGAVNGYQRPTHFSLNQIPYDSFLCYHRPVPLQTVPERNSFKLFPNPASDKIFLKGVESGTDFSIISLSGSLVCQGTYREGLPIDINDFKPGIYILKVGSQHVKFIKQ